MGTDRLSSRGLLAALLVGSAALFLVGVTLERAGTGTGSLGEVAPSTQPEPTGHVESSGGEAGEVSPTAAPASGGGEIAGEHAAEARPFGIDLESPVPVGGAIALSLALAVAVLRSTGRLVPGAIAVFAVPFGILDLLEVNHQLGAARPGLAVIAIGLLVAHAAVGVIAVRLLRRSGTAS